MKEGSRAPPNGTACSRLRAFPFLGRRKGPASPTPQSLHMRLPFSPTAIASLKVYLIEGIWRTFSLESNITNTKKKRNLPIEK